MRKAKCKTKQGWLLQSTIVRLTPTLDTLNMLKDPQVTTNSYQYNETLSRKFM